MSKLFAKLQDFAKVSASKVSSETTECTIIDIVQAPSVQSKDGKTIEKVRVITKEFGSLWCFKDNVVNALSSYGEGVKAKITIVPNNYTDSTGAAVEGFNLQRVVIQAIDSKIEAAISKMPAGTALFASAGAL